MAINICIRIALSAAISCVALPALAQAGETVAAWTAKPAHAWTAPTHMMLMDAARAGRRVVTVGEHGLVLLSDDDGRTWRQARSVPVAATLSAVTFVDAGHGWAVGQWGVILATSDGGETWHKQRLDLSTDQPLFSVAFTSPNDGIAVGLWSLMLATHDGGKTWERVTLPKPPGGGKADRNLYHIFFDGKAALYVVSESGMVLKSADRGANWAYVATGGKGTLWTGVALPGGRIVVGGLLGSMFESTDGGASWRAVSTGTKSSITDLVATDAGLMGVGLDGLILAQRDGETTVTVSQRADRATLTAAVIAADRKPILVSQDGVLAP
ncbi:WD40/YVTN/BNR-like repeat-containing protein [Burkholderia multivorans]|uniref:Photosynthesis system II assembly factor Ycf48/Hcf136-like domain-containing protein n=1 Tax=Burkholderia multivorans (strain ATCC 17616 / 249) TaxID=395019 RepID=A0A0H3KR10_BURM1|nr:YCF48-related protein [Burkholderia multivorans]ABX18025.1 glycosyl hydrolase BNR repeat-containing protein [Burkholderia multivorans ATCC 17616]PRF60442.1 glycosyl hydrolase [Burkholderia multivorans]BAG46018.1 conserved hypothetical protein [Burkholderia multivorans ATCC 17616]